MMAPPSLSVWVTIADPALRRLVTETLGDDAGLQVAARSWPARGELPEGPLDAVVCDPDVPETPAALRHRLRVSGQAQTSTVRCVLIASTDDPDRLRAMLTTGADAVVLECDVRSALVPTIRAACAGQLVVPRALSQSIARPALTTREKQILGLVVMGFSNREIADQLVVAESTVKSHLFTAFRRLGVRTRREAVALILDRESGLGSGILSISDR